jgi:hypothetical protein
MLATLRPSLTEPVKQASDGEKAEATKKALETLRSQTEAMKEADAAKLCVAKIIAAKSAIPEQLG